MNEEKAVIWTDLCLKVLYPEYYESTKERKEEIMGKLFDEIHELGLEALVSRVMFMLDHEEGKV